MAKKYAYFITRTDFSKSQQLVQTAHVALKLGNKLTPREANHLFFCNLAVPDLAHLNVVKDLLHAKNIEYVEYHEGHYNEITAIATFPITEQEQRNVFKGLPLI